MRVEETCSIACQQEAGFGACLWQCTQAALCPSAPPFSLVLAGHQRAVAKDQKKGVEPGGLERRWADKGPSAPAPSPWYSLGWVERWDATVTRGAKWPCLALLCPEPGKTTPVPDRPPKYQGGTTSWQLSGPWTALLEAGWQFQRSLQADLISRSLNCIWNKSRKVWWWPATFAFPGFIPCLQTDASAPNNSSRNVSGVF